MYAVSLLWVTVIISVQKAYLQEDDYDYEEHDNPLNCSITETIRGGHATYSQDGLQGSVLAYHCDPGHYPFPVSHRLCNADGEWSPMRLSNGRRLYQAICKEMVCPGQLQLDHGEFWPRDQWLRPGEVQSFSCQEGFTLYGSAQRNCTLSGHWTGTTPICENHANDCKDPGVPPGAQRSGDWLRIGEELHYQCQSGLDLLGSAVRVCLENREWSGSAPRCQAPNTFDSLSVVAEAMSGSLSGVMDVLSPESKNPQVDSFARTVEVNEDSRLNIFILLDTSASITKDAFDMSRKATIELIRKLDSYEVQMKFHIISFASRAIDIVTITDTYLSSNADHVIMNLENFNDKAHGTRKGTNLNGALQRVSEMIALFKQNSKEHHFNETQNIIIIATDGYSNTGGNPHSTLAKIRSHLGYNPTAQDHTEETLLDVYVFGVGSNINKKELNTIASKKRDESHFFAIESYANLEKIFNEMISDKSSTKCGVAKEDDSKSSILTNPWHVNVSIGTNEPECSGSIVSQNWVLTAAHCFKSRRYHEHQKVEVHHGGGKVLCKQVIIHPKYNISTLQGRNVSEFYDYDVALVKLNASIPLSWKARPICLPCTVAGARAMKKVNSTCKQHREELLPHKQTAAFFIHKAGNKRQETHIQMQEKRQHCVEKAILTFKKPTDVTLDEYVPDRFLCSGGSEGYQDTITCKGDSGGSLFIKKIMRYFQVGIVSWGTVNICDIPRGNKDDARDFHISLFDITPWLEKHLGHEIKFLPVDN